VLTLLLMCSRWGCRLNSSAAPVQQQQQHQGVFHHSLHPTPTCSQDVAVLLPLDVQPFFTTCMALKHIH
jgi:hypothetical protein